ncbi:restriction endonuclease subunit S [Aliarcobacter skirrowii]|uniref:Restriction endonuclease subunit S n=1 Tax=Aliarcobacter skirrowii TaxID=28200 RepID=A0A2U2C051_9BACT|nr:restriction endonuclease subunit S [Aliarcobacter skirrowii]PWE20537.1 restriction endonuclease subunit S [Aliarcobacter skirrowii]PWE21127.1 restriction endonuclease subunit S [Aliarcobacter skirrowii]RJO55736.1 restriction endonuclease subunit S [Aliarcobacter skirrowii]RJO57691.1 restriction endonuclease subunit S [Aliarcobacter skirrowii]
MSDKTMKNIPKLRFPEFLNEPEWKKIKLNKLGKLVSGLTYSPDDIREDGLLVLRSSNVQDGEIKLEDNVYVRTDIKGANLSKPNDILICVRNGSKALIGKNALIPDNMPLCTHGAFMTVFRAELPKFVFQLFKTKDYERQVNADLGATINSINGNKFIKYEFYVPTTEKEQQKIADCLSSIDSLITVQGQKIELLKEHKKGLLQNLFPRDGENVPNFRFPEFKNNEVWEEKKLSDLIHTITPPKKLLTNQYLDNGSFPIIDQSQKYIVGWTNDEESIIREKLPLIIFGDHTCALKLINQPFAQGADGIKIFEANSQYLTTNYLYQFLQFNPLIMEEYKRHFSILKDKLVKYPNKNSGEQQKIADCLSSIDEKINLQSQKLEILKEHKKALLQQLFPKL